MVPTVSATPAIGRSLAITNQYAMSKPPDVNKTAASFNPQYTQALQNTKEALQSLPYLDPKEKDQESFKMPESVKIIEDHQYHTSEIKYTEVAANLNNYEDYLNWLNSLGVELRNIYPGMFFNALA